MKWPWQRKEGGKKSEEQTSLEFVAQGKYTNIAPLQKLVYGTDSIADEFSTNSSALLPAGTEFTCIGVQENTQKVVLQISGNSLQFTGKYILVDAAATAQFTQGPGPKQPGRTKASF